MHRNQLAGIGAFLALLTYATGTVQAQQLPPVTTPVGQASKVGPPAVQIFQYESANAGYPYGPYNIGITMTPAPGTRIARFVSKINGQLVSSGFTVPPPIGQVITTGLSSILKNGPYTSPGLVYAVYAVDNKGRSTYVTYKLKNWP